MSRKSPSNRELPARVPTQAAGGRKPALIEASLLVLITGVVWWSCVGGTFLLDDVHSITDNPTIRDIATFAWLNPPGGIGETVGGRPLLNFTFAVDYALHGGGPAGYHVTNILIHLAAALAVMGVGRRLLEAERWDDMAVRPAAFAAAFAVALLWALHPLQTAAVTYLSQRAESLAGLFVLVGLYAYLRSREDRRPGVWRAASAVAALLGAFTKETAIVLPILVGLHIWWKGGGQFSKEVRKWRGLFASYAAVWALWVAIAFGNLRRGGSAGWETPIGIWDYLITQCRALGHYLRQAMWPDGLVFDFGITTAALSDVWTQALVIAALLGLAVWGLTKRRAWGVALGAFFVLLAPSSSIAPVATQTIAEHRMYLALLVPVGFGVAGWARVARKLPRPAFLGMLIGIAGALAMTTRARNALYGSPTALWADTVAKVPSNARAHNNLGVALLAEGRTNEARAAFARAVEIKPNHAFALHNLGTLLLREGSEAEAVNAFRRAVAASPESVDSYLGLGVALMQLDQKAEAERVFEMAIRVDADSSDARIQLARLWREAGRDADAVALLQESVAKHPALADAHYELGVSLEQRGDVAEALVEMEAAARLRPDWMPAQLALGNLFARLNKMTDAERAYREAVKLEPKSGEARYALGSALARREAFAEAIAELSAAVAREPDHVKARANLGNCLLVTGRIGEAIACYDEVLRRTPGDAQVMENRAVALELARARVVPR